MVFDNNRTLYNVWHFKGLEFPFEDYLGLELYSILMFHPSQPALPATLLAFHNYEQKFVEAL